MRSLAISLGDPRGIGPEVVANALADRELLHAAKWLLIGPASLAQGSSQLAYAQLLSLTPKHAEFVEVASNHTPGTSQWAGDVSFLAVEKAIALVQQGTCDALVTAPISKAAWASAGHTRWPGHTELLAERFASSDAAMMFHAPAIASAADNTCGAGINLILATVHIPLSRVASSLTTQRIVQVAKLGAAAMQRMGVASPRLALAGLNPHAGEGGLLGTEDKAIIAPAAAQLREQGLSAVGPLPADTLFAKALSWPKANGTVQPPSHFDLIVAMYHDQGLAPLKMIAWDRAVNMTVGLRWQGREVVRTSPDHGTAFDITGKGLASAGSMRAAMWQAVGSLGAKVQPSASET